MTHHTAAAPLPLLLRDIARDLGISVPQACIALKPLGNYSTNSAVTAEMARILREAFPNPAPQAVQAVVPLPMVELFGVKDGQETSLGPVPMPPTMRARELLQDIGFRGLDDDDGDGAYAMAACEQLIEYCKAYYEAPAHPAEGVPAQTATAVPTELLERVVDSLASFAGNQPHKPADLQAWEELNDLLTHRAAHAATQPPAQGMEVHQSAYTAKGAKEVFCKKCEMTVISNCGSARGCPVRNIYAAQAKQGGAA